MGSVEDVKKGALVPIKSEDRPRVRASISRHVFVCKSSEFRRCAFPFLAKIKKSEKRTKIIWEKS